MNGKIMEEFYSQAIPTTVDGKPIKVGDIVWVAGEKGPYKAVVAEVYEKKILFDKPRPPRLIYWGARLTIVYSSRELATKACLDR